MNRAFRRIGEAALAAGVCVALSACAERAWMMVPAKVDLAGYQRIGLAELDGPDVDLRRRATRELGQRLLDAQPGTLVIELGPLPRTDGETLRALAREHGLSTVFVGAIEFSDLSPSFGVTSSLVEVQARAEILGTLSARLVEAESGATVWMQSVDRSATVASAGVNTTGDGNLGIADVEGIKTRMIAALAQDLTHEFRAQYFQKKVEDIPPHYRVTYPDGVEVYVPPDATEH